MRVVRKLRFPKDGPRVPPHVWFSKCKTETLMWRCPHATPFHSQTCKELFHDGRALATPLVSLSFKASKACLSLSELKERASVRGIMCTKLCETTLRRNINRITAIVLHKLGCGLTLDVEVVVMFGWKLLGDHCFCIIQKMDAVSYSTGRASKTTLQISQPLHITWT